MGVTVAAFKQKSVIFRRLYNSDTTEQSSSWRTAFMLDIFAENEPFC